MASVGDLDNLNYTNEDWPEFQLSLHLLESACAVYDRSGLFEAKLWKNVWYAVIGMRMDRNESSMGSGMQLLSQSTLDSAGLHSLLDSFEP
jgi:conserved oligomeric Golgi complex subunit 7